MKLKVEKKYMFRVKNIERSFESQVENCWPLDFELLLSTWKLFFFLLNGLVNINILVRIIFNNNIWICTIIYNSKQLKCEKINN